jgi:hypothetical protein
MSLVWTAVSGWIATVLLGVGAVIPYYVRSTTGMAGSNRARLRPHYWIGFLLPAVAFVHAWLPMSEGGMRSTDLTGLLLATIALLAILGQVSVGLGVRRSTGTDRRTSKRIHFWTMVCIASLIAAHVLLNRA